MNVGDKFGEWTIIELLPNRKCKAKCSCGNEKDVYRNNLTSGKSTNCGCVQKLKNKERMTTHGQSMTKLYHVWSGIKRRCYNPNQKSYFDYGGRGIKMNDIWKNNFEEFYNWAMSTGYIEGKVEIDRIDVNGDYTPENCRWISKKKNANNKRNNHYVLYEGKRITLSELSELNGLSYRLLLERLNRGWNIEDAINVKYGESPNMIKEMVNDEELTLKEISEKYNIKKETIMSRYSRGIRGNDLIKELDIRNGTKKILCYKINGEFVKEFESIKQASEETGVTRSQISKICHGKIKRPKKYIFKFKEEN